MVLEMALGTALVGVSMLAGASMSEGASTPVEKWLVGMTSTSLVVAKSHENRRFQENRRFPNRK